jgi:hypothetical protein
MASDEEVEDSYGGEEEAPEEVAGDPIDNEPESDEAPIKHGVNKKT